MQPIDVFLAGIAAGLLLAWGTIAFGAWLFDRWCRVPTDPPRPWPPEQPPSRN
jgi:hypothetical protein